MADFLGTCPACFRVMSLVKGKMGRHGWNEVGGRVVGSYGNAWHEGACFGVGYEPFEISTKGTIEYLAQRLRPSLQRAIDSQVYLAGRPEFIEMYEIASKEVGRWDKPAEKYVYQVRYVDGQAESKYDWYAANPGYGKTVQIADYKRGFKSYDGVLEGHISMNEMYIRQTERDIAGCEAALASWVKKDIIPKVAELIHASDPTSTRGRKTYCGQQAKVNGFRIKGAVTVAYDAKYATCPDCVAKVKENQGAKG